jgi:urate oxidase
MEDFHLSSVIVSVRLVKVIRGREDRQEIMQMNVQILLEGDNMENAFTEGNNKNIVPTDTCKNTVYCVASQHDFKSIEEFGLILARFFLTEYPNIVHKVNIKIASDNWERILAPDSRGKLSEHKHTFKRIGPQQYHTHVCGEKKPNTDFSFNVTSGFKSLEIMKTTQSGFVDFNKNKYTSLPEVTDRLLGTSADVEWNFNKAAIARGNVDFNKVRFSRLTLFGKGI